jgi:hypothetical protein
MKPLQHAQISQKTYGGCWSDYIEVHSFLDSSKAACAHFKHRFLLHHAEGVELGVRIFGASVVNRESRSIPTRQILAEHLIEDLGRIVTVEDWARSLVPESGDFYKSLAKKRGQIESGAVRGERELLSDAFNLTDEDISAAREFLSFPLKNSTHPAALLVSHNSFAVFLAEKVFGYAFAKNDSKKQFVAVREVFERVIFLRMKTVFSPAEIVARTASAEWMRGADAMRTARKEKERLAGDAANREE